MSGPLAIFELWKSMGDIISHRSDSKGDMSLGEFLYNNSSSSPVSKDPLSKYFNTSTSSGQFDAQRFDNHNATQIRVKDALKAGINPLAALGVSSNVSPTIMSSGSASGGRFSKFSNMLFSFFDRFAEQKSESNELDLESKRLQNDILRAELTHLRQPGLVSGNASMEQPPIGTDSQIFRVAYDLNGDPRLMVNQDITENDSDNAGYISSLQYAYRHGGISLNGHVRSPQLRMKIADDYYRATGRPLQNADRLYISPSELAIAAAGAWRN